MFLSKASEKLGRTIVRSTISRSARRQASSRASPSIPLPRAAHLRVAGAATGAIVLGYLLDRQTRAILLEESPPQLEREEDLSGQARPHKYLTLEEVAKHNLSQDAWVILNGNVYDLTHFHQYHPGGAAIIVSHAGQDVSSIFNPIHPPGTIENSLPPESFKGRVDPSVASRAAAAQEAEKARIKAAREALPPVETILGLDEFQDAASKVMSRKAGEYYHGGALDGISKDDNKSSFRRCRLVPRVLRDVSTVAPQTEIFGIPSALPIYISPASNALLGHPDGELNLTRGAGKTGIVQGISYVSSYPLSDILAEKASVEEAVGEEMGMVFQVYVRVDREKTASLVRDALEGGCKALLLTVDSNAGDFRQSVEKMKGTTGSAEPGRKMAPFTDFTHNPHDPRLNWSDLEWLKSLAGETPIYLKGVSSIEDVRLAKEHGMRGCILSNHGGRQLDRARTGFDSLRAIHAADPDLSKQIELYVDGGVRRGSDVLMAVALGAKGVGLGRSFLYAQAAYGEKGAIRAVRILESEIVTAMQLMGVTKLEELRPEMVDCLSAF